MKAPDIKGWWNSRQVGKIRDQYKYNLMTYAHRHTYEKSTEDGFLIGGLLIWVFLPLIGNWSGYYWLGDAAIFIFLFLAFFPFIASFLEVYRLSKRLTLTMNVIPDNPENTYPIKLRLQGVEFGPPMQTKEALIDYIKGKGAALTSKASIKQFHKLRSCSPNILNEEAERIMKLAQEENMRLYPMTAKGDDVPALAMFPDVPDKSLRPREERVRLSFGIGSVRHATIYAFECKPVKTSIQVKGTIIDVEYALFAPFFTQTDLDRWIENNQWFIPSRVAQDVATYVKQNADTTKNATTFATLEKERDDAVAAYQRLLLHQQYSDIQRDVEGDVYEKYRPKKNKVQKGVDIVTFIAVFLLGFFFHAFMWG